MTEHSTDAKAFMADAMEYRTFNIKFTIPIIVNGHLAIPSVHLQTLWLTRVGNTGKCSLFILLISIFYFFFNFIFGIANALVHKPFINSTFYNNNRPNNSNFLLNEMNKRNEWKSLWVFFGCSSDYYYMDLCEQKPYDYWFSHWFNLAKISNS